MFLLLFYATTWFRLAPQPCRNRFLCKIAALRVPVRTIVDLSLKQVFICIRARYSRFFFLINFSESGTDINGGEDGISAADIYRAFPDFSRIDRKWECILPILFAELFKHPTVYTAVGGKNGCRGAWIEPRLAVFNTIDPATEEAHDVIMEVITAPGCTVKVW